MAEQPVNSTDGGPVWGSDYVAESLRLLGIEYISLNPGASYRGLHDSLVNHLGNKAPAMLLCLHEEHAVAIAHGYAKVTDRPMAVALHSNVGLLHASMAIFNAFCDRVPMLLIGATGPVDASHRRPWIDWLHTTADQAALVRPYLKWDDQPASVAAALPAMMRAYALTASRPCAPTYVCLDVSVQETSEIGDIGLESVARVRLPDPAQPSPRAIDELLAAVRRARQPLLLIGRVSRDPEDWQRRVQLAEALDIPVLTHQKLSAAFPVDHRLHALDPVTHRTPEARQLIRDSDLVISLDWLDLGGMLVSAGVPRASEGPRVISISHDARLHTGWGKEHFDYPNVALSIECDPDAAVAAIVDRLADQRPALAAVAPAPATADRPQASAAAYYPAPAERDTGDDWSQLRMADLANAVLAATEATPRSFIRLPSGWPAEAMRWRGPLDYLGRDGGEGIGSGPGMAIGGALALRGSDRLPVAIIGDGDAAMGCNALWTATHDEIPLLLIVANNSSYLNDEIHQTHVARLRGRPVENAWVGQRMTDPPVDFAGLARAQGWQAIGPIETAADLGNALTEAVTAVRAGARVLLDVRIQVELERLPRVVETADRSV